MAPLVLLFFLLSGPDWISSYEVGDCGISNTKWKPSNGSGESLRYNEFPWAVALYKLGTSNSSKVYQYLCSGSIIDANTVLTAAHCVFDEITMDTSDSRVFVAAGKYNSSWEHWDPKEQRFEVISKKFNIQYQQQNPYYLGIRNRYRDDIALLGLNGTIKFSDAVMPVCMEWGVLFEPRDVLRDEVGTVASWGLHDNHVVGDKLKSLEISIMSFEECVKNARVYYSRDRYCAVTKDNSSDITISSGGGVVFHMNNTGNETRYFIKAILVGRSYNAKEPILLLTKLSNYLPWMNSTLKDLAVEFREMKGVKL